MFKVLDHPENENENCIEISCYKDRMVKINKTNNNRWWWECRERGHIFLAMERILESWLLDSATYKHGQIPHCNSFSDSFPLSKATPLQKPLTGLQSQHHRWSCVPGKVFVHKTIETLGRASSYNGDHFLSPIRQQTLLSWAYRDGYTETTSVPCASRCRGVT